MLLGKTPVTLSMMTVKVVVVSPNTILAVGFGNNTIYIHPSMLGLSSLNKCQSYEVLTTNIRGISFVACFIRERDAFNLLV